MIYIHPRSKSGWVNWNKFPGYNYGFEILVDDTKDMFAFINKEQRKPFLEEFAKWCNANLTGNWEVHEYDLHPDRDSNYFTFFVENEEDMFMIKLRW